MKSMTSMVFAALFAAFMLTACVIATPAPPLPATVELDVEPYYYQSGYYYFYENDRWQYSRSRSGPWTELPRSHWPKEIKRRGREERGGESKREHEER